jgi:hypothetical protein
LIARLARLQRDLEQRQYDAMTFDVNRRKERQALAAGASIKSMTQQSSIAMNMIISAITMFVAGYWIAGEAFSNSRMVNTFGVANSSC